MNTIIKSMAVSVAAIALATAAHAESKSHGAVKTAAKESHGEPSGASVKKKERSGGHGAT